MKGATTLGRQRRIVGKRNGRYTSSYTRHTLLIISLGLGLRCSNLSNETKLIYILRASNPQLHSTVHNITASPLKYSTSKL